MEKDSFATFLNTYEQLEKTKQTIIDEGPTQEVTADRHVKKLINLLDQSGPQPVTDLITNSEMAFRDFVRTAELMQTIKVIAIEGPPGKEVVRLTSLGEQMTHLEV